MSLILQSSSGGQITIQEPATASNFTQTLPASDGTVITTGSPQQGSVIQVVQNNSPNSGHITTTSTTPVSSGLTITITPKRANSLIRVDFLSSMGLAIATGMVVQFYRDGVGIGGIYSAGYLSGGTYASVGGTIWVQPPTTAATTFTVFFSTGTGGTAYLVHLGGSWSLTATEYAQ